MRFFLALSLILSLALVSSAIAAQQQGASAPVKTSAEQIYLESEIVFDEMEQLAVDRNGILVTGTIQSFYQNGRLAWETQWVEGKLHGITRGYHENRTLKEETMWVDGKLHGLAKWYDESGNLIRETMYENGRDLGKH